MEEINIEEYWGKNDIPNNIALMMEITREIYTTSDTGISQRVINHWDKEGLLPPNSHVEGKWRRFSLIDYLWIKFIEQLRMIGLSLALIKEVRDSLFSPLDKEQVKYILDSLPKALKKLPDNEWKDLILETYTSIDSERLQTELNYSIFSQFVLICLAQKKGIRILVFLDGDWMAVFPDGDVEVSDEDLIKMKKETHVSVSIMNLILDFIADDYSLVLTPKFDVLSSKEQKILSILHSGEYESVKINFKNKEIKSLELVKEENVRRKVVDILSDNSYQDVIIKTHDGLITRIQNTVKIKMD